MPILNDILDHQVLGPAIRQGLEQGRKEGAQQTREEVLRRAIENRFGIVPAPIQAQLAKLSQDEWEAVFDRIFKVSSVDELFPC